MDLTEKPIVDNCAVCMYHDDDWDSPHCDSCCPAHSHFVLRVPEEVGDERTAND